MDQSALVDTRIDDGQTLILHLVRDNFDVTAAFWLKTTDQDLWHLFIASKAVDESGPAVAYRALQKTYQSLPRLSISLEEIKLIGVSHPFTRNILRTQKRRPAGIPAHVREVQVWNNGIEEAIIYPPPSAVLADGVQPMTSQEVLRKVMHLMNRAGSVQQSTITLQDGTAYQAIPFGVELSNNVMVVKFLDTSSQTQRAVAVTDILSMK